jgi:hypothetical protein
MKIIFGESQLKGIYDILTDTGIEKGDLLTIIEEEMTLSNSEGTPVATYKRLLNSSDERWIKGDKHAL